MFRQVWRNNAVLCQTRHHVDILFHKRNKHSTTKYIDTLDINGVRIIKLNDPASRNSLSLGMLKSLLHTITENENTKELRSIVITSDVGGKVFSSGHNLKELIALKDNGNAAKEIFQTIWRLMQAITSSSVPIIAAVDGLAAAAGCQLVATCDIAICTERSSFSTPGANVGIFCSTPGIPLVRNVPKKVATYMLYTGFPISAKEAYEAGLVSKVVPHEQLENEVSKITDAINAKSRSVVQIGKKFLNEQLELKESAAYSIGTDTMLKNLALKDAQEGIKCFMEKRKAKWNHDYD